MLVPSLSQSKVLEVDDLPAALPDEGRTVPDVGDARVWVCELVLPWHVAYHSQFQSKCFEANTFLSLRYGDIRKQVRSSAR